MTASTPPGASTRWQAAYTSAGSGPRRRAPAPGAAAGAVAAGDGQGGLPGVGVPRRSRRRAAGPQPGQPGRGAGGQPGERAPAGGDQAEDSACGRGGLDHRGRAVGCGDQVAGPGERGDDLSRRRRR